MRNPGVVPPDIRTPNSNNCSAECAPERGNKLPAQGNTLGEQGTKQAAPRQGKSVIDGREMLLPLLGRNHHTAYNTQGVALGYLVVGPPGRRCAGALLINPNLRYD